MKFKDPNVYFNLIDNSQVPAIYNLNGACIIGAFNGGQAYVPTVIDLKNINLFGKTNGQFYAPYALNSYALHSNKSPVVIRTLWSLTYGKTIYNILSGSTVAATIATKTGLNPAITVSGSQVIYSGSKVITASLDKTTVNSIDKMFSYNPASSDKFYLYYYDNTITAAASTGSASLSFSGSYDHASTPYIKDAAGNDLFKVHAISDGDCSNTQIKVIISNIKNGTDTQYATFNLTVRDFSDTDNSPVVLLSFSNLNLDPASPYYIARVIGDQQAKYNKTILNILITGDFKNMSSYIRILTSTPVTNRLIATTSYPWQYSLTKMPISGTLSTSSFFVTTNMNGDILNKKTVFGYNYSNPKTNLLFNQMPLTGSTVSLNFNLSNASASGAALTINSSQEYLKFSVPVFGGTDGISPSTDFSTVTSASFNGFDLSTTGSVGTKAFLTALDLIANKLMIDIDIICIPGLNIAGTSGHSYLINKAIAIALDREDCVAIFDADSTLNTNTIATLNTKMEDYDNNYAAFYYPAVKIYDVIMLKYVWLPSVTQVIGAYAYNDKVGYYWLAPAGYNRAALDSIKLVKIRLSQNNRALLYDNRINPIAMFPNMGYVVWGQKTAQKKLTALNRINVRRLVIRIKRFINRLGLGMLYLPNTSVLWDKFLKELRPYLKSIVLLQGLYAYDVIMDSTINTPDTIDRNILKGKVIIQPTKAVLYIAIDFVINRTSAE